MHTIYVYRTNSDMMTGSYHSRVTVESAEAAACIVHHYHKDKGHAVELMIKGAPTNKMYWV